jgi:hypothetical protein
MQVRFHILNAPEDQEKAVLPALIYIGANEEDLNGFMLMLGWWHWGASVSVMWMKK